MKITVNTESSKPAVSRLILFCTWPGTGQGVVTDYFQRSFPHKIITWDRIQTNQPPNKSKNPKTQTFLLFKGMMNE